MLITRLSLTAFFIAACAPALAMEALEDEALSAVHGQQGVIFDIALQNNVDDSGNPIGCSGALNPCRFGLELADQEGAWLMFKEFYGSLRLTGLQVEVDFLPETGTGFAEPDRFRDTNGNCLIEDCDPRGEMSLKLNFPENKQAGVYEDLRILVNIGRTALEFDNGATPGFDRDAASGSFLGYRLSDSIAPNAEARARFNGDAHVFGF